MEIPRLDTEHRIGDTFGYFFKFRQTDGVLRSFTGSTAVFHGQSGATTFHFESGTDSEVTITDVPEEPGGGIGCGILVNIPYSLTETWTDGQKFFYELKEWAGGGRYTLIEGNITATIGVVDGSD